VMVVLQRHGKKVVDAQLDLKRLADCAINIYAAFSSVSRASRSYCIGLHNAEYELNLAAVIATKTRSLVEELVKDLEGGTLFTLDQAHIDIGNKVFEKGGYYAVHPLTKNFI
jgi:hypothetical protein